MLKIGDRVQLDGRTYIITTDAAPIETTCIGDKWYPAAFTASAYSPDDTQADGWQDDYYIFFDLLPGADCTADHETLCDWENPTEIDWSGYLYNPSAHEWK